MWTQKQRERATPSNWETQHELDLQHKKEENCGPGKGPEQPEERWRKHKKEHETRRGCQEAPCGYRMWLDNVECQK